MQKESPSCRYSGPNLWLYKNCHSLSTVVDLEMFRPSASLWKGTRFWTMRVASSFRPCQDINWLSRNAICYKGTTKQSNVHSEQLSNSVVFSPLCYNWFSGFSNHHKKKLYIIICLWIVNHPSGLPITFPFFVLLNGLRVHRSPHKKLLNCLHMLLPLFQWSFTSTSCSSY